MMYVFVYNLSKDLHVKTLKIALEIVLKENIGVLLWELKMDKWLVNLKECHSFRIFIQCKYLDLMLYILYYINGCESLSMI